MIMKAEGTTTPIIWTTVRGTVVSGTIVVAAAVLPGTQADASYRQGDIPQSTVTAIFRDEGHSVAMRLLNTWVEETAFHSSPSIILRAQSFLDAKQRSGDEFISYLLELLNTHPYHAILALGELVSPLPFGKELAGDVLGQAKAWKEWASAEQERSRTATTERVSELGILGMGGDEST